MCVPTVERERADARTVGLRQELRGGTNGLGEIGTRADTFMPASPLVQVWLASIYATVGDKSNAARYVATLTKMAPGRTRLFMQRPIEDSNNVNGRRGPRIFDGLRLALGPTLG